MRRNFRRVWASRESGKSHGIVDADPADLRGGGTESDIAYDDADDAMMMGPLGRSLGSLGLSLGSLGIAWG